MKSPSEVWGGFHRPAFVGHTMSHDTECTDGDPWRNSCRQRSIEVKKTVIRGCLMLAYAKFRAGL